MYTLHLQKKLYSGSTPVAFTLALSNFIFFYTLQYLKKVVMHQPRNSASFLTSTIAGVINVLLTNPFWVANLRIVKSGEEEEEAMEDGSGDATTSGPKHTLKRRKGIFQTIRQIIEQEGISQLWNGTGASLLLVSNPAIQYYTYERIKMDLIRNRVGVDGVTGAGGLGLRPMEAFVLGAFAKGLATVVTYPLQLAQVLMRLQKKQRDVLTEGKDGGSQIKNVAWTGERVISQKAQQRHQQQQQQERRQYHGILDCMMDLYKQGGMRALYSGMDAKLLQTVLTAALTFLTYEELLQVVSRSYWAFANRARPSLGPAAARSSAMI